MVALRVAPRRAAARPFPRHVPRHVEPTRTLAGVFSFSVAALLGTPASAADVRGTVATTNSQTRTVTIEGVPYLFPEEVGMVHLLPGDVVTLTYNATGTGNVVERVAK